MRASTGYVRGERPMHRSPFPGWLILALGIAWLWGSWLCSQPLASRNRREFPGALAGVFRTYPMQTTSLMDNSNREMPDTPIPTESLMTADEAARFLHVPRSTLYELVPRSRGLPHVRIGERGLRFTAPTEAAGSPKTPMERAAAVRSASHGRSRCRGPLRLLQAESCRDSLGRVLAIYESEVAPGSRQVGVAHPLHDLARVGVADHGAAKV